MSGQSTLEPSQVSGVTSSGSQAGISALSGTVSGSPASSAQPALSAKTSGSSPTDAASFAQSSVSDAFAIASQTATTFVAGGTTLRYRKETIESLKSLTAPITTTTTPQVGLLRAKVAVICAYTHPELKPTKMVVSSRSPPLSLLLGLVVRGGMEALAALASTVHHASGPFVYQVVEVIKVVVARAKIRKIRTRQEATSNPTIPTTKTTTMTVQRVMMIQRLRCRKVLHCVTYNHDGLFLFCQQIVK